MTFLMGLTILKILIVIMAWHFALKHLHNDFKTVELSNYHAAEIFIYGNFKIVKRDGSNYWGFQQVIMAPTEIRQDSM